jgi:hypothetical protein
MAYRSFREVLAGLTPASIRRLQSIVVRARSSDITRSMKNRILLENYYLPGQLEQSIGEFVDCRYQAWTT